jgi:hypothetical protein
VATAKTHRSTNSYLLYMCEKARLMFRSRTWRLRRKDVNDVKNNKWWTTQHLETWNKVVLNPLCTLHAPSIALFVVYLMMLFQWLRLYSVEWKGGKQMISWKGCGRKWTWPNFKVLSQHLLGGTEENHKKPVLLFPVFLLGQNIILLTTLFSDILSMFFKVKEWISNP